MTRGPTAGPAADRALRRVHHRLQGKLRASFSASGTRTRSELGVVAELKQEAGSMRIGDDITLDIEAEADLSSYASHESSDLTQISGNLAAPSRKRD